MADRSYLGEAITNLLNDLPKLIMQMNYQSEATEKEYAFRAEQAQLDRDWKEKQSTLSQELSMIQMLQSNANRRADISKSEGDRYQDDIDKYEDEISILTKSLPGSNSPDFTEEGSHLGSKILEEFTGPQKAIVQESITLSNKYSDIAATLENEKQYKQSQLRELNGLKLQSEEVSPYGGASSSITQVDDFIEYWDRNLEHKYIDNPNKEYFKSAWLSMAPSFKEQQQQATQEYAMMSGIDDQIRRKADIVSAEMAPFATQVGAVFDTDTGEFTKLFKKSDKYNKLINIIQSSELYKGVNKDFAEEKLASILNTYGLSPSHLTVTQIKGNPLVEELLSEFDPVLWYNVDQRFGDYELAITTGYTAGIVPQSQTKTPPKKKPGGKNKYDDFLKDWSSD